MSVTASEQLLTFVRQAFGDRVGPEVRFEPATPLFSSQLVDSMGLVELLAFVERQFGVSLNLTIDELIRLDTVERLANEIERRQRAR